MKVLIVVTHLLGSGHLARALTLARAFSAAGHAAHVVSGGMPAQHLHRANDPPLTQLPPLRSDGTDFSRLLTSQGTVADAAHFAARQSALGTVLDAFAPDAVITELFPFGRRVLKAEFEHLLALAHGRAPRPIVLASVRDILAPPSKPAKATYAENIVAQHYDGVLVHSDPHLVPLTLSWPVSDRLAPLLRYTGFVAPPRPEPLEDAPEGEVLVSAGGGDVGAAIFGAALEAARADPTRRWRLFVPGGRAETLAAAAPANLIVAAPDPDFRRRLVTAAGSVSMCGYNTALDLLQTGVPAVLIPFDADGEVEQTLRARALSQRTGFVTLPMVDLTSVTLLAALVRAQSMPGRQASEHGMDGAARSVAIVETMLTGRRA